MKKKIKTWLIHLLGGVTVAENRKENQEIFYFGMISACIDIRDYADFLYGKPADEWCELMYEFILDYKKVLSMELTKKDQRENRISGNVLQ